MDKNLAMTSKRQQLQFALGQLLLVTFVVATMLGIARWIWPLTPVAGWLGISAGSLLYTTSLIAYARGASVRSTIVLLLVGAGCFVYAAVEILGFWQDWV